MSALPADRSSAIAFAPPSGPPDPIPPILPGQRLTDTRARLQQGQQWFPGQMAGRRWSVACVSLEITQRCNLDCSLCYLSESSEAVRDFPLDEVFRRIDMIAQHYGTATDVQVSGGEPTLRQRDELVAIVQRLTRLGLRASLLTNGIKATRDLLAELSAAGLSEVVFHVDMTQQRAGYGNEEALNTLRQTYINRARGLGLGVFFNTTVFAGNFDQLAGLARFFVSQADTVRFASFQLQAETGRGVLGQRADRIDQQSVAARLAQGAGVALNFDALAAGHQQCNRFAVMLVAQGRAVDALADTGFVQRFMRETASHTIDRRSRWRAFGSLLAMALTKPALSLAALRWAMGLAWELRAELFAARGQVHKLTFFTHNFMDARSLDCARVDSCVFMAMTQDGPLSMCAYNARRDEFLLRPLQTLGGTWQPLRATPGGGPGVPIKWLKGRSRAAALRQSGSLDTAAH